MNIQKVQDINISDKIFKNDFSNKYQNGQYIEAYNVLENGQLNSKKFVAEIINSISNELYSIEENYYNNTDDYLNNLTEEFQLVIDNYRYIGVWDSSEEYRIYNIVTYSNKYYIYINDESAFGVLPTNTAYWCELDLMGEKGADGIGVNFIGTWDSTTSYSALDGVYYNGSIWCAKLTNINQIPSALSSYWESVVTFHRAQIISSTSEPTDKYNGLIWMEMSLIS